MRDIVEFTIDFVEQYYRERGLQLPPMGWHGAPNWIQ